MRILNFEVFGLLGQDRPVSAVLHHDMNIITGRNGAGKTTAIKLLWYILSGNIVLALREVPFTKVSLTTDLYKCTVSRLGPVTCRVEMEIDGKTSVYDDDYDPNDDVATNAEDVPNEIMMSLGSSVFLPTFRRIEGGFTLTGRRVRNALSRVPSGLLSGPMTKGDNAVEEALLSLSRKLTNRQHVFVSAMSTADITQMLLQKYAEISEVQNQLQSETSQQIIDRIKTFQQDAGDAGGQGAAEILEEIKARIEAMENSREAVMAPLNKVRDVVERLFEHSGIIFDQKVSFGNAANAIASDMLSAGEKQMLSFVCYNAFYNDAVFFIDEPELSLHVDWQRQLFPILSSQGSSNQFIVATHSPFIYSKYSDKEIMLGEDRGDVQGEEA